MEINLLLAKQTQVRAEKTSWAGIKVTQKYMKKNEMLPAIYVAGLCKTHAVWCSKISDVHEIEVHVIRI